MKNTNERFNFNYQIVDGFREISIYEGEILLASVSRSKGGLSRLLRYSKHGIEELTEKNVLDSLMIRLVQRQENSEFYVFNAIWKINKDFSAYYEHQPKTALSTGD